MFLFKKISRFIVEILQNPFIEIAAAEFYSKEIVRRISLKTRESDAMENTLLQANSSFVVAKTKKAIYGRFFTLLTDYSAVRKT